MKVFSLSQNFHVLTRRSLSSFLMFEREPMPLANEASAAELERSVSSME